MTQPVFVQEVFVIDGGAQGLPGPPSYTTVTTAFVQPNANATVPVQVGTTSWMTAGMILYVAGGGYYTLTSITDGANVVLTNLALAGNASSGATIAAGAGISPSGVPGPAGGSQVYSKLTGPVTITATPNIVYVCDVTGGSVVISLPSLALGQFVGVLAAAGGVNGAAYATNSITVNADSPQTLALPAPGNLSAPAASYVIGGAGATSGDGALDAGTSLNWVNGGITNVLTLQ